jgi:hypothetical protein
MSASCPHCLPIIGVPRPFAAEPDTRTSRRRLAGQGVADTTAVSRPYYLPRAASVEGALSQTTGSGFLKWKSLATHLRAPRAAASSSKPAGTTPNPSPTKRPCGIMSRSILAAWMPVSSAPSWLRRPKAGGFYGG